MRENMTAASVDIAARDVISAAGYGETFTHRVGHGIGIKDILLPGIRSTRCARLILNRPETAHESPYLHKGNVGSLLKSGMTFTSEPGIYLVDKFGVRHEDVLLVEGDGEPQLLTERRAIGPWNP